jgi:hypothetical protein
MSGVHVRYFFFTLTVAATLFVARIVVGPHAQSGAAGSTHVAGRVIVKFRDGTSTVARVKSLSLVSVAGRVSERPSYANFDLVRIDPNDPNDDGKDGLSKDVSENDLGGVAARIRVILGR